ncbi:MAG: hypothetical protein AAB471_00295 [Patescibacteria group bacterium]
MEILSKLLGGAPRVKIMRLFLFNPGGGFSLKEVSSRSKVPLGLARQEVSYLMGLNFIKRGKLELLIEKKKGKKVFTKKLKIAGFFLNKNFAYIESLRNLLIDYKFLKRGEIIKRFRRVGNLKLLVIAGVFIKDENSRADILIVGDHLKRNVIERSLKNMEAEIGKELRYAVLNTKEFIYRLDMYDKFIRDILDYPHERLIEKIKVE